MRVTNNMLVNNMVYNLNQNLKTLEMLQYQKATGKKFRVPSDDPIGVSKSLKFNTDISKLKQYERNAKDAMSWMTDTEAALGEIGAVLHRANELTIDAANGTKKSPEDLQKIREEIVQLKEHLIQIGNTTYAGRHIFSGYKTDKPLLDEDGNYNIPLTMKDKDEEPKETKEIFEYNVGVSERVKVNTLGGKVFGVAKYDENENLLGPPDYNSNVKSGDKPYLIAVFEELSTALDGGEVDKIQKAIGNVQKSHEQVLSVRAEVGAKMNRLELTQNKLEKQILSVKELLSYNEDVDLAEISMQISTAQNVYVSSLMTGAKIIQPTLVEFLR
jgi:flagellar hook-associated protein 3 FlgL